MVEQRAFGGAAGDVGIGGGLGGVKEWLLLRVAAADAAWLALDPGEVAAGVENHRLVPPGGAEAHGDDVVGRTKRAAGVGHDRCGERAASAVSAGDAVVERVDSGLVLVEKLDVGWLPAGAGRQAWAMPVNDLQSRCVPIYGDRIMNKFGEKC